MVEQLTLNVARNVPNIFLISIHFAISIMKAG